MNPTSTQMNPIQSIRLYFAKARYLSQHLLIATLLFVGFPGSAQTNTWDGSSNANWNTAANWSLNQVPTAAHDVVIPNGGSRATITVNTAAVCKSLVMTGGNATNTINISGTNSLSISGALTIGASSRNNRYKTLNVNDGTLSAGTISITAVSGANRAGSVTLNNGTVNVAGFISMGDYTTFDFTDSGILNVGGNISGGTLNPATGTVNFVGPTTQTIMGSGTSTFYNVNINKDASGQFVNNNVDAITVNGNLTVTKGKFVLNAPNADAVVNGNIVVATDGTIEHRVNWDIAVKLLRVFGNIEIDGVFTYTVRSHVQMAGAGTKYVRTGNNPSSGFSILTLTTGNYYASGATKIKDNFWAMFGTPGSFHTNGNNVTANSSLLIAGGTVFVDGGNLNVSGGTQVGYTLAGNLDISNGSLNTDILNVGDGSKMGIVNHSGGTVNVSGNFLINSSCKYNCTNAPVINIGGNWTSNNNTGFDPANSVVTFSSNAANQILDGAAVTHNFYTVNINKAGRIFQPAGSAVTLNINGDLNINQGTFDAGSIANMNIKGDWKNNAVFNASASMVQFNGTSEQTISGSATTTFNKLTINNPGNVKLSGANILINGGSSAFTFTDGKLITGVQKVTLTSNVSIAGAGVTRYVNGILEWGIQTGNSTKSFAIGDDAQYTPVSLTFGNVSTVGNITVSTTSGDHTQILSSQLSEDRSVNRIYTISNSGVVLVGYNATFNFGGTDVDVIANTNDFIVGRYSGGWSYPSVGTRTATSTAATSLTAFGSFAIAEGGAAAPVVDAHPNNFTGCPGYLTSVSASFNSKVNTTVAWYVSTDGGVSFNPVTLSSPYSASISLSGSVYTSTLTINPVNGSMSNYRYRAVASNSRGNVQSNNAILTISVLPTVNAGPSLSAICSGGTSAPLGGTVGGGALGGFWSSDVGGTFSPSASDLNATYTPPAAFYGTATLTLTTTGGCTPITTSKTLVVNQSPDELQLSTISLGICANDIGSISVSNHTATTMSSGVINLGIPNYNPAGVTNTLSMAGIPSGAIINSVKVTLNISHSKVSDLILNLKAPNGKIINLFNRVGSTGANFVNTEVSSIGTTAFSSSSAPFTGTFAADAISAVGATGLLSNTTVFNTLFSIPNGGWTLVARDAAASNTGSITSWSIEIDWTEPLVWSPSTNLFTDALATIPYTGQSLSTVYVKGTTASTTTYTVTATGANGCTRSANSTVEIHPIPEVNISADYCWGPYTIRITTNADLPIDNYLWNTGDHTRSLIVDIAGTYTVTAYTAEGCAASANIVLGLESVDNGNFELGNIGFSSTYVYRTNTIPNNMYPEDAYTVHNDGNYTHGNFWGKDHTSGSGNFMIVNGSGTTPPPEVWTKTISVIPNTTYYFSAWAMSLNSVGPFANLQFSVNGVQVGSTTGALPARPENNNPPFNWTRFFGTWNSGVATTAVVSIVDLETATGGNDFGLDDISFGTLAPFVLLNTPGKDIQTVCKETAIDTIEYTIGGGGSGPIVTGLPPGLTTTFVGTTLTISGIPTTAGVFNYTIKTAGGCLPAYGYGTITVNAEELTLTSSVSTTSQTVCVNTAAINITYAIGGVATGAAASGLPAGVTGVFSNGVLTISGTPIVLGNFNYTVTTSGPCEPTSLNGTMSVVRQLISLTSAPTTTNQTLCLGNTITDITYNVSGSATGASVTGLPTGVTGSFNSGVFTISGTPTQYGAFHYTVTTNGLCSPVSSSGDIIVQAQTATLTSAVNTDNQSVCINSTITNITYSIGGTATGASVTGLPAGISGNFNSGVFTISGASTQTGTFNYEITTSGTCNAQTIGGTIDIFGPSIGGLVDNASVCSGGSGSLILTGFTGAIVRWESSNDLISWTPIVNSTSTQNYSGITSAIHYRVVVQLSGCNAALSTVATVGVHNLWTGAVDNDWHNTSNWSDGLLPSASCDNVLIPVVATSKYPELTGAGASIKNLIINSGASVKVDNATLAISGTITNNGTFDMTEGTLELNGTSAQSIAGSSFYQKKIKFLQLSNSSGVSLIGTNDTLKITGELGFGNSNSVLTTNGNLTMVSDINGTSRVADLTSGGLYSGNDILGDVTVERYIPEHAKAWQLLSVPTNGSTIKSSWQEGNTALGNIHPGYGTIFTGNLSNALAQGFDVRTPAGASIKTYNSTTNVWDGVTSTNIGIANKSGYMIMIRGDRSVTTSSAPATATTLRTTGQLYTTGINAPENITIGAGKMASIGNPYASAIDFANLNISGGVSNMFYVWDPRLTNVGSSYGLGGYQTFTWAGADWVVTPGGGSYTGGNTNIESGQAFMVSAPYSSGTVSFSESAKVSGSNVVHRSPLGYWEMLRANLYSVSGGTKVLVDGVMTQFNQEFSNEIDENDARKLNNLNENIAIVRNDTKLAVESHYTIQPNDTLFYSISQMRLMDYELVIIPRDLGNTAPLQAFFEDNFLQTSTKVDLVDTTRISFTVTNAPGSYAPNRFRIVFKVMGPLPVNFIGINATKKNDKTVDVKWDVTNELSMQSYEVERSVDGRYFVPITTVHPIGNNGGSYHYSINDASPNLGNNYYRIKGISINGTVQYSPIVLVGISGMEISGFSVYPNPVVNQVINIRYSAIKPGKYLISLISSNGQIVHEEKVSITDGAMGVTSIYPRRLSRGVYTLRVEGNINFSQQVIVR